jgi:hypothetical protein
MNFPCLVLLVKAGVEFVAKTVNDIPNGHAFRVLKTNYIEVSA